MPPVPAPDAFMGKDEACQTLDCCRRTLERYVKTGLLHTRQHGKYTLLETAEVKAVKARLS